MNIIGELLSLLKAICLTITALSFEHAGRRVGSMAVNIIRLFFAFAFLAVTLFFIKGSFIPLDATTHQWSLLFISGIVGMVLGDLFLFQAFVDVGSRISLLVMASVPAISTILAYLVFHEIISTIDFIGMTITIVSIVMVILAKNHKKDVVNKHAVRGILFATIGALGQSGGLILSKLAIGNNYSAFAATEIRVMAAIIGFIIYVSFAKGWKKVGNAFTDKKAIKYILIGSFFGPFLGVVANLMSIQYTQVGIATTISQLNVIFIILISIIFFKEKVNTREIVWSFGALLGVAMLFLF